MAIAYNTSVVRDGLVLYLDAANKKSYPGVGTAWNDLSGNGNNATLLNGPIYSPNNNGSIVLDGVDDYVNVSNPKLLNPGTDSFSVNTWVKQKANNRYNGIVEARGSGLNGFLIILNYSITGYLAVFLNTTTDGSQNIYTSTVPTFSDIDVWMNVCVVVTRSATSTIDFYLNGVKQGNTRNVTSEGTTDPGGGYIYWIGADLGGPEAYATFGTYQHYNRALTSNEIQQNYNALRGRYNV